MIMLDWYIESDLAYILYL